MKQYNFLSSFITYVIQSEQQIGPEQKTVNWKGSSLQNYLCDIYEVEQLFLFLVDISVKDLHFLVSVSGYALL